MKSENPKLLLPFILLIMGLDLTHVTAEEGLSNVKENLPFFEAQRNRINSADPNEIRDAIDKLSFVKSNLGVRDIISALRGSPNFPTSTANSPQVKFYAAKALGKKGESIALEPIIAEFNKQSVRIIERENRKRKISDGVRGQEDLSSPYFFAENDISMVLACGEMIRALAGFPLTEESEKTVKNALAHKNFYIRSAAADAIFLFGKISLTTGFPEILSREKDEYTKISILSALAGLEKLPNQNFKLVLNFLKNEDPEIRKKASEALVRMDLRLGATYLEKAINVENNPSALSQMKEDYKTLISFRIPE